MNTKPTGKRSKSRIKPVVVCDACRQPYKPVYRRLGKFTLRFCSACGNFGSLSTKLPSNCKHKTATKAVNVGYSGVSRISVNYCKKCNYVSICDHCGYNECCGETVNKVE